jgi:phosphoglycolate phosphatase
VLDAVLFDLDGTLTDPAEGITGSFRHALAAVGHAVPDDTDLRWMIGPAIAESLDRHGLAAEHHDAVIDGYRSRLREVGLFQAALIDGMPAVLDALRSDGIPLALASAKMIDMGETTLEHFGLLDRFAAVAGTLADGKLRTKGQIVGDALAALGGPDPARVAMVGDRLHDIEGAREQGCIAIAVSWGFAEPGELDAHAPDHVVTTPAELLALLRSLG